MIISQHEIIKNYGYICDVSTVSRYYQTLTSNICSQRECLATRHCIENLRYDHVCKINSGSSHKLTIVSLQIAAIAPLSSCRPIAASTCIFIDPGLGADHLLLVTAKLERTFVFFDGICSRSAKKRCMNEKVINGDSNSSS